MVHKYSIFSGLLHPHRASFIRWIKRMSTWLNQGCDYFNDVLIWGDQLWSFGAFGGTSNEVQEKRGPCMCPFYLPFSSLANYLTASSFPFCCCVSASLISTAVHFPLKCLTIWLKKTNKMRVCWCEQFRECSFPPHVLKVSRNISLARAFFLHFHGLYRIWIHIKHFNRLFKAF